MSLKYIVIEEYESQYKTPIKLSVNEVVKVGERFAEDPDWPGWIWCENSNGEKGWVLERVLKIEDDIGVVLENYDARELDVKNGEVVEALIIEGGWIRCRNSNGESGWVPEKNVKLILVKNEHTKRN